MTTTKPEVRLIVRIREDNSFGDHYNHLETEVVYWDEKDRWVTCYGYSTPSALRGFDRLGVRAQADHYKAEFYGGEVSYHELRYAKLEDIKRMAATLTAVQRKLDKLNTEFGWPKTVADQIIYFAKAVGCKGDQGRVFGFYDKDSPMQDEQGYAWTDADGMAYRVKKAEEAFAKKYNIQKEG